MPEPEKPKRKRYADLKVDEETAEAIRERARAEGRTIMGLLRWVFVEEPKRRER
ncbi:MAG: hypothetical protein ACLGI2_14755 [Acidimicrobiia bacterium]